MGLPSAGNNLCQKGDQDSGSLVSFPVIHIGSLKTYGSPRIYKALKAESISCSRSHIIKIMQQQGLAGIQRRKYCVSTTSDHDLPIAENLLNRNFKADKANQKWDNSVAESFFSSIKRESVYPAGTYKTVNEARSAIFSYIEGFYNRSRNHSYLRYVSQDEFESNCQEMKLKNVA